LKSSQAASLSSAEFVLELGDAPASVAMALPPPELARWWSCPSPGLRKKEEALDLARFGQVLARPVRIPLALERL